ncbi:MAG: hypothetical protein D6768_11340 [Chloroflexi bacterium]|nr:MAG: hypothetical protein D6768_11340 [Chloroflexota bacterium]
MQWLIDGHNLIGQLPGLRLSDPNDEAKLLERLRSYRAKTGHKITVVFDPGGGYRPGSTRSQGGITVKYAASGQTADQVIARRVKKVKNPQAWGVVSSDHAVQRAARNAGIRVVSSAEFAGQMRARTGSSAEADPGSKPDVSVSPDEVDEWLNLFNG